MKEKLFVKFNLDIGFAEKTLLLAGYTKHKKGLGYYKNVFNKKRFHVYIKEDHIEIHLDITFNGKHMVADTSWEPMVNRERKKIKQVYKKINPPENTRNQLLKQAKIDRKRNGLKDEWLSPSQIKKALLELNKE